MSLIDIIKPLSTILSSAVTKSQQHQMKNSWDGRESNRGPLGSKQEGHPLCYAAPFVQHLFPSLVSCSNSRVNLFFILTIVSFRTSFHTCNRPKTLSSVLFHCSFSLLVFLVPFIFFLSLVHFCSTSLFRCLSSISMNFSF